MCVSQSRKAGWSRLRRVGPRHSAPPRGRMASSSSRATVRATPRAITFRFISTTFPTDSPMRQDQFLDVIDRDEAERRFHAVLDLRPLKEEEVALARLLGRILARDVVAPVDVPSFDRSNVDGYAVRAEDVFGCSEEQPARLNVVGEPLLPGRHATLTLVPSGGTVPIATGAMIPRGANAVVMVEYTDLERSNKAILVRRPVAPGDNVTFAGTDIGQGETVLRRGELLTSRET